MVLVVPSVHTTEAVGELIKVGKVGLAVVAQSQYGIRKTWAAATYLARSLAGNEAATDCTALYRAISNRARYGLCHGAKSTELWVQYPSSTSGIPSTPFHGL